MRIAQRLISHDTAPYIIAELGVNHDGSLDRALELTRAAAKAGADAVKLQVFRAESLMSRDAILAAYQKSAGESDPIAMLTRLELSLEHMREVVSLAHSLRIHAIATVFSVELVHDAAQLPWDAFKTASPDIVHRPLLETLAATGKPLIVSTGASTLQEVGRALNWLRPAKDRLTVLQCVSAYPTPFDDAELPGINAIQDIFDGPVGYSDHTESVKTGALAVVAGACMLEKHFTYDKAAKGPDHSASLTADEFARYRKFALLAKRYEEDPAAREYLDTFLSLEVEQRAFRLVRTLRTLHDATPKTKRVLPIEYDVRTASRQSLVAGKDLPVGHKLTLEDITFKRPGTGIPPYELLDVLGLEVAAPIARASLIQRENLRSASR